MHLRYLEVLAFALTCSTALPGHAAELLSLQEAVTRSLASNPLVAAEMAAVKAAEAAAKREALPTPYVVGADLENFAGTGALTGVRFAETTLRLSRVIELGEQRETRAALGAAKVTQQQHQIHVTKLKVASHTTKRYIAVVAARYRLNFAQDRVKLAEETRRVVAHWVDAARNPASDLQTAEIAVAEAQLALEHAQHELASARLTLAASWGANTADFTVAGSKLHTIPAVESFAALSARLPKTVAQHNVELEAEVISAQRRAALANANLDVNLSLGVRRFEAFDDQGLVMSVSVPLGSRPRSELAVAEADARLAELELRRKAQLVETRQSLFALYQELRHARTEHAALSTRMLPKAEEAYAMTRRGFEAGRFSFLKLKAAQRTLFELRERSVMSAARFHTLLVKIERLTALPSETTP